MRGLASKLAFFVGSVLRQVLGPFQEQNLRFRGLVWKNGRTDEQTGFSLNRVEIDGFVGRLASFLAVLASRLGVAKKTRFLCEKGSKWSLASNS